MRCVVFFVAAVASVVTLGSGSTARAAGPLDTALAAFALEAAAPLERVRIFVERDGVADAYFIDRLRPGRVRIVKNPREDGQQIVVVGPWAWLRTTTGWVRSPAGSLPIPMPSMAELFRAGLTEADERAGDAGGRDVRGRLAWIDGAPCDGSLLLHVGPDGRPALLRWEGTCAGHPGRFREAFSYDGPLTIEPPS